MRAYLPGFTFIVLFICFGTALFAQDPLPLRSLTKKDGLSQNSVIAITQDADGFMWFGTRDGLNRYDGNTFRVYRNEENDESSLPFNNIHTLYQDTVSLELWVGTTRGLCRYRPEQDDFQRYPLNGQITDAFIHCFSRGPAGHLWVGTTAGLFRYQADQDTFTHVQGTETYTVRSVSTYGRDSIFLGTTQGLLALKNPETAPRLSVVKSIPKVYVQEILQEANGGCWIATRKSGLYYLDDRGKIIKHFTTNSSDSAKNLSNDNIRCLAKDPGGNLWVGTFIGLNRLRPGENSFATYYESPLLADALKNHSIHSLFVDHQGGVWVGSYYGGVAYHHPLMKRVKNYSRREGQLSHGVVSTFSEDTNGNLWIGTEGGGLNYFDRKRNVFTTIDVQDGLVGNNIKSLLLKGEELWVGTYPYGISRVHLPSGLVTEEPNFQPADLREKLVNVYDMYQRGDTLWLALYGNGLARADLRSGQLNLSRYRAEDTTSLATDECRSILEDHNGKMWIATAKGLAMTSSPNAEVLSFHHFLNGQEVYCLTEATSGLLWAGTYGQGIFVLDITDGTLREDHPARTQLGSCTVYSIVEDNSGKIWLNTSKGTTFWDPVSRTLSDFDFPYELMNQEFRINSVLQTRGGELAFGGTEGFVLFRPGDKRENRQPPTLVFTDLQVANVPVPIGAEDGMLEKSINNTEALVFPYNRANFSLSFAALDFLYPQNNHYQYQLEGVDEGWINSRGRTEVSYTLQNAGNYRFRVRAANSDGNWTPAERTLEIKVRPPPWRSWYAYCLYLLLAGLVITAFLRYTYLRHQLQLEQAAKDQQEDLHRAKLRFFTNITHEIRTPLTLMIGPLESIRNNGDVKGAIAARLLMVEKNSRRLLQLVNQLLSFRKLTGEHETLQLDGQDLVVFCRGIVASFEELARDRRIDLEFSSTEPMLVVSFDPDKMEKVLYNLLGNACKFTSAGGRVSLHLRREGTRSILEVSDNGEGIPQELQGQIFARFFERKSLTQREGTGIGLAIVREYVEMHGGEISVLSTPGEGSTFTLWIPLRPVMSPLPSPARTEEVLPVANGKGGLPHLSAAPFWKPFLDTPPLILLVEDNLEVRDYLESILVEEYRLETAINGKEGITKAQAVHPDLVISDVMMPEMDGFALCHALKKDLLTSHVPIILLTAKSTDLQRLEGLATGADDYLTKPFSPQELLLRVRNILLSVFRAREKAGRTLRLDPGEVKVTPADTRFLEQAIEFVNLHMDDSNYKVDNFARDLTVSRALLFTKVKAITGRTPNEFIKMLRMKRAAQLIATGELNVAEVAGRVGYRDVKYFSKSFRVAHGCSPSAYRKRSEKELKSG